MVQVIGYNSPDPFSSERVGSGHDTTTNRHRLYIPQCVLYLQDGVWA